MNRSLLQAFCTHILITVCIVPVAASDIFSMSLEELMEVEVSGATFSKESVLSTPASVSVFSSEDIERLGVNWVHELANFVPGFQSKRQSDNSHHYSLSARGRQIGTGTRSVKVIINGLAVTSGYIASSSASIYGIPTSNISKIEFIRGPGSVVHGSGALLGIINIETFPDKSEVGFSLGSHEHVGGGFQVSDEDYYFTASFSGDAGHEYSLLDPDSLERVDSKDPKQDYHIYLGKNLGLTQFSFHHHRRNENGYYGFDRVDNYASRSSRSYTSFHVDHMFISDRYFELTGRVLANNRFAQFAGRLSAPNTFTLISNPSSDDPLLATTEADSNQYGFRLLGDQLLLNGNLSVGAEYIYSDPVDAVAIANFDIIDISQFPISTTEIRYYGNDPVFTPFVEPNSNQTFSLFSELQYRLSDKLNSITSLRYDYASNIDEGEILPRIALVYGLSETQYLKFIHSQAFRNPGAIELHATNNNTLLGNEDLTSEIVRSNEVIWTYQSDRLFTNFSIFETQIDNSIEQAIIDGRRVFINLDQETNRGAEFEFRINPIDSFQLNLTYHYLEKMLDSAFRLSDNTGSFSAQWGQNKWVVGINGYYHSESQMYANANLDLITLPSYWNYALKASYDVSSKYSISLHIGNLLDETYYTPTISAILPEGLPSRGREIIFSINSKIE